MNKLPLILLIIIAQAQAEPSSSIANMIATPATAFDMFLFRIYESAKCNNVVNNANMEEADLCLSSISYDADRNILAAFFRVQPAALAMEEFVDEEEAGRKTIMLQLLDNTAKRLGAVDGWGLLHSIPISHGWKGSLLEEKAFRAELAGRTTTSITTSYSGVVYVAKREADGTVKYFTRP